MRIINLLTKDLIQVIRDWKAATFLVAMPIAFTLFFGFIFGGMSGGEEDPRLPLGFLDQDGSTISAHLSSLLETSDAVRLVALEDDELDLNEVQRQVGDQELTAALIVPPGYGDQILAGEEALPLLIVDPGTATGATAQGAAQAAIAHLHGAVRAAQVSAQAFEAQGGVADEAFVEEALERALEAWREPPLTVTVGQSSATTEEEEPDVMASRYAQASPGMMVQFSIAGVMSAAQVMVLERKSRSLQRLLTTAISRPEIILGHYLTMFVMIFLQLALLVGFGQLALGLNYMREPIATLLLAVTMSLWAASLGLLVGVLAKSEEQAVIFSMLSMFILSGLGGAWMPLEVTGEAFQTIGHLLPTAWAMDGMQNIIVRGLGLESALLPAGIMAAYAAAFFALAVWRFRSE